MEKRKNKSRIKYIGGANESRRNKSTRNKSRRNKSRRNKSNGSRINRSKGGSLYSYLPRSTQNVRIKITDGLNDYFIYSILATEATTIGDLKKSILERPGDNALTRDLRSLRLVWGVNCALIISNNNMRLDDKDENITLGRIENFPFQEKGIDGFLLLVVKTPFISQGYPTQSEQPVNLQKKNIPLNIAQKVGLNQVMKYK